MKNIRILFAVVVIFSLNFASCKKPNAHSEVESIVTEWVGKTIRFPDSLQLSFADVDTVVARLSLTPYKILIYSDSSGCTSCKLQLSNWKRFILNADTSFSNKFSYYFYFQPKNVNELKKMLRYSRFFYPVYIDSLNLIDKLNNLPTEKAFQTFLLDKNNKVLSIGDPVMNPEIWELYKQIVTGEIDTNKTPNTEIELIDKAIELTDVKIGVKHKMTFRIKNIGKNPLAIVDVKTSCGCTNAKWEKQPIEQKETTKIQVEVKMDNAGYFAKTLQVYCNVDNSPIVLTIKGNAK